MKLKLGIVLLAALSISGCDWFRGLNKDGVDPPAELADFAATARFTPLWSRDLGGGGSDEGLRLQPTLLGDRVYATSLSGGVSAINADTGAVLWTSGAGLRTSTSPGVDPVLVVVGTLDAKVLAFSAQTGAELWRADASAELIAAPAVSATTVVVRSHDGRVFGLDAADGRRKWVFDRSVPLLSLRGNGAPVIVGSSVIVPFDSGQIFSLALETGVLEWEEALAQGEGRTELERMVDIDGSVTIEGSTIYAVSYQGRVGALALDSGRVLWNRDFSAYGGVAANSTVVAASDASGSVFAFDDASGVAAWSQKALANRFLSTPAISGDYIVVGDLEGWLHALAATDGALAARIRVSGEPIRGAPIASGDRIYLQDVDGRLAAFQLGN